MSKLFVVIEVETGSIRFDRGYLTKGNAKLALRNRLSDSDYSKHAVACVEAPIKIISTIGIDGKWKEVSE